MPLYHTYVLPVAWPPVSTSHVWHGYQRRLVVFDSVIDHSAAALEFYPPFWVIRANYSNGFYDAPSGIGIPGIPVVACPSG